MTRMNDPLNIGKVPPQDPWFWSHYEEAAAQVIDFFSGAGAPLDGMSVADIGCGDGITDLGIAHKVPLSRLVGFDVVPTDVQHLDSCRVSEGIEHGIPDFLTFRTSEFERIPANDEEFDIVISWSAFEHIGNVDVLVQEIRRILRPEGLFFCQIWPLYFSEHGSHLERWYPHGFAQLRFEHEDVYRHMLESDTPSHEVERMWSEFQTLNKLTLDEFGEALRKSDFDVLRLELLTHTIQLPPGLSKQYSLSDLATSGFKLLAR